MTAVATGFIDKASLPHDGKASHRTRLRPNIVPSLASKLQNVDDFSLESIRMSFLASERGKLQSTQKAPNNASLMKTNVFSNNDIAKLEDSFEYQMKDKKDLIKFFTKRNGFLSSRTSVPQRSSSRESHSTTLTPRKNIMNKFITGDIEIKTDRSATIESLGKTRKLFLAISKKGDEAAQHLKGTPRRVETKVQTLSTERDEVKSQKKIKRDKKVADLYAKLFNIQPSKKVSVEKAFPKWPKDNKTKKDEGSFLKPENKANMKKRIEFIPSFNLDDLSGDSKMNITPAAALSSRSFHSKLYMKINSRISPTSFTDQIRSQSHQRIETFESPHKMDMLKSIYAPLKEEIVDRRRQNKKLRLKRRPVNSPKNVMIMAKSPINRNSVKVAKAKSSERVSTGGIRYNGLYNYLGLGKAKKVEAVKSESQLNYNISPRNSTIESVKRERNRGLIMKQNLSDLLKRYKRVLANPGPKKELKEKTKRILEKMKAFMRKEF